METLIWYSAPGAVLAIAILDIWPALIKTDGSSFLVAVALPVLGFGIHQFYRLLFEITRGFERQSRPALKRIRDEIASKNGIANCSPKKAFLIWETTFYGNGIPTPFREHDRNAWHFILSFESTALAAALGVCSLVLSCCFGARPSHLAWIVLAEALIGVIFALKAHFTYQSLMRQELVSTFVWYDAFAKTCEMLQTMS
jgi:hypothetical protein